MALCLQNQGPSHASLVHFSAPSQETSGCSGILGNDSIVSEENDIYNAVRGSTTTEDEAQMLSATMLDNHLAANMAMFTPLAPTLALHQPLRADRRLELLSEQQNDSTLRRSHSRSSGRKAFSLNDVDDNSRVPLWPESLMSPVQPVFPKDPPPARSPTPPGLPSFGTQEAVCYSAQFLAGYTSRDGQGRRRTQISANARAQGHDRNGNRTASYGQSLRRLFHLPSSSTTAYPPSERDIRGIGRAENGTAVLGRFPHRQSGHGVNTARQLEDHPFHRMNLPIAECEDVGTDTTTPVQRRQSEQLCTDTKDAPSFPEPVRQPSNRLSRVNTLHSRSDIPQPTPRPTATTYPETPASTITTCALPADRPHQGQSSQVQVQLPVTAQAGHGWRNPLELGAGSGSVCYMPALQLSPNAPANSLPEESPDRPTTTNSWTSSLKTAYSYFFCCLEDEPDRDSPVLELRSSHSTDTYATARSWDGENNDNGNETSPSAAETDNRDAPG